jgi:hypothetical protein
LCRQLPGPDDVEVNLLLAVWVFLLILGLSAAVIAAYLLPPEEDR